MLLAPPADHRVAAQGLTPRFDLGDIGPRARRYRDIVLDSRIGVDPRASRSRACDSVASVVLTGLATRLRRGVHREVPDRRRDFAVPLIECREQVEHGLQQVVDQVDRQRAVRLVLTVRVVERQRRRQQELLALGPKDDADRIPWNRRRRDRHRLEHRERRDAQRVRPDLDLATPDPDSARARVWAAVALADEEIRLAAEQAAEQIADDVFALRRRSGRMTAVVVDADDDGARGCVGLSPPHAQRAALARTRAFAYVRLRTAYSDSSPRLGGQGRNRYAE